MDAEMNQILINMVAMCSVSTEVNSFCLIFKDNFIEDFEIPYSNYLPVDMKNNEIKVKNAKWNHL